MAFLLTLLLWMAVGALLMTVILVTGFFYAKKHPDQMPPVQFHPTWGFLFRILFGWPWFLDLTWDALKNKRHPLEQIHYIAQEGMNETAKVTNGETPFKTSWEFHPFGMLRVDHYLNREKNTIVSQPTHVLIFAGNEVTVNRILVVSGRVEFQILGFAKDPNSTRAQCDADKEWITLGAPGKEQNRSTFWDNVPLEQRIVPFEMSPEEVGQRINAFRGTTL